MSIKNASQKSDNNELDRRTFVKAVGASLLAPLITPAFADVITEQKKATFNPNDIRAIVFDTVGTLADYYGPMVSGGEKITRARGVEVDWNQLITQWDTAWRQQLNQIIAGTIAWKSSDVIYKDTLDNILAAYPWGSKITQSDRAKLNELWYESVPWPDTNAGMARLRTRYTLCALSNGSMASVIHIAKQGRMPFDCILTAELVQSGKPDPKVYALAARSLNLRPDQILMVAAHKYDLAAAHKFGFHVAFLPRLLEHGGHGKVDTTPEDFYALTAPDLIQMANALGT